MYLNIHFVLHTCEHDKDLSLIINSQINISPKFLLNIWQ